MQQEPLASVHDLSASRSSSLVTGPLLLHFLISFSLSAFFKLLALDTPGLPWNNRTVQTKGVRKGGQVGSLEEGCGYNAEDMKRPKIRHALRCLHCGRNLTCSVLASSSSPCSGYLISGSWLLPSTIPGLSSCRLPGRRWGFLLL